jgi:hypothetical protein
LDNDFSLAPRGPVGLKLLKLFLARDNTMRWYYKFYSIVMHSFWNLKLGRFLSTRYKVWSINSCLGNLSWVVSFDWFYLFKNKTLSPWQEARYFLSSECATTDTF